MLLLKVKILNQTQYFTFIQRKRYFIEWVGYIEAFTVVENKSQIEKN